MNTPALRLLSILSALAAASLTTRAAIVVPGANGTDGVLNITVDTEIDLSQAVTGTWNQDNSANAGKGVYDSIKWAVVFKYSSVTVAAGKTLTFKNHASRAPVVWLVSGDVTIAGTVSLDGKNGVVAPLLAEGGPGGFRGGVGIYSSGVTSGPGFGVGGGNGHPSVDGTGGSYGSTGTSQSGYAPSPAYGNPSLIPLLGGSGGSGTSNNGGVNLLTGGGGGGGAILIASTSAVSISGAIRSNGGVGANPNYGAGTGSGGGLRVVADTLSGTGSLAATGAGGRNPGGLGRIRLERVTNTNSIAIVPDPSVVPLSSGATAVIWPAAGAPEVKIVSVGGAAAPADPRASFGSAGADVALPQTASTQVIIETANVEQASQVKVRVAPRASGVATSVDATVSEVVSVSPLVVRWTATLPVNVGYSAVQVKVIRP